MNNFRENDILILIGAGCSKEAGIPTSIDMVQEIESLIGNHNDWKDFKELYHFIKSSILYADGLKGKYDEPLNIERLVNTLYELEKKEEHPIYPFIGSWNSKVTELCGNNFQKIAGFKKKIIKKLKDWVTLDDYTKSKHYKYIIDFPKEMEFPLRLFSLNYDLCLEKNGQNCLIEKGFNEDRIWQWQRFEKNENVPTNIYLYKMHGSIDWKRKDGFLTYSDEVSQIEEPDLIFGTNYKLQYVDPYLFFAYEFRRYSLEARLLISIGYGYGDEHINGIIGQAMRHKKEMKLIANIYDRASEDVLKKQLMKKLGINNDDNNQLDLKNMKASDFLKNELKLESFSKYCPTSEPF